MSIGRGATLASMTAVAPTRARSTRRPRRIMPRGARSVYGGGMNRTDRLLAILLEFQARRQLRAEDLAARFEVSVRTIYRDVGALTEGGVPIAALPGIGYQLLDGYFLPPLLFTADEAAALALGGGFVRDRVDTALRHTTNDALRKLEAVLPLHQRETVARRGRELIFPDRGATSDDAALAELRGAIQEHQVVRLLYHRPRSDGPETRDVEPVSLAYVDQAWHLTAYCRLRQAPRIFRLTRIDRFERLPERYEPGVRHAFRGQDTRSERPVNIRVRVDPPAERWLRERQPFAFTGEEQDAAGTIFSYAVRDEEELLGWLLSWGPAIEVLSPPGLRARLAQAARDLLSRYSDTIPNDRDDPAELPDRTVSGAYS